MLSLKGFAAFFAKVFKIFNDFHVSPFRIVSSYQYLKITHETERRRKNLKWCITRKKIIRTEHSLENRPSKKIIYPIDKIGI